MTTHFAQKVYLFISLTVVCFILTSGIIKVSAQAGSFSRADKPTTNIEGARNFTPFNKGGFSVSKDLFIKTVHKRNAVIKAKKEKARLAKIEALRKLEQAKAVKYTPPATTPVKTVYPSVKTTTGGYYIAGQCVWGVSQWRPEIPKNWGSGYQWFSSAQKIGWPTGSTPRLNAVAWDKYGNHVALVIKLNPLTIKEMNALGPFKISTRVINASDWLYIY